MLDYYATLGLTRFRQLALKFHPDRDAAPEARTKFVRACEAYDVLSNRQTKGLYDLHGEESLKFGKPDGQGGVTGGSYTFNESQCLQVFKRFFGTDNPFEALEGLTDKFQCLTTPQAPTPSKKQVHPVKVTLEEIFYGCIKKVKFQRRRITAKDQMVVEEKELTIDVKAGMPEGTRFVFEGEGNVVPGKTANDIVFVLETLPHERFKRSGADLVFCPTIPLYQALTGPTVSVPLLDSSSINVPIAQIVSSGHRTIVAGMGLPNPAVSRGARGDVIIEPYVAFPSELSEVQKMLLKAAFYLPKEKEGCVAVKDFQRALEDPLTGWATGVLKK